MASAAVGIINAVFGSDATFGGAPKIENTTESIKSAWSFINSYEPRLNYFCNALVDRIGLTVMRYISFEDPWQVFDKGVLSTGATVQEIYVMMQKATPYFSADRATNDEVMKAEFGSDPADVYTAYHAVNSRIKYKVTVNREALETAFMSEANLSAFVQNVIDQIYKPAELDAFIMKKYLLYQLVKNNKLKKVTVSAVTDEASGKTLVKKFRQIYGKMKFISKEYNAAGIPMNSPAERLYTIVPVDISASIDVDVLASAFNMDKADFMGHRLEVDSFALNEYEVERLEHLLTGNDPSGNGSVTIATGGDKTYTHVTPNDEDMTAIQALMVDRDFFQKIKKGASLKATKAQVKKIRQYLGIKDESVEEVYDDPFNTSERTYVWDTDLADSEIIPWKEDQAVYLEKNVAPYAPDYHVDEEKTRIGYEIPFTREFYRYTSLKPSSEIFQVLKELEQKESEMMESLLH